MKFTYNLYPSLKEFSDLPKAYYLTNTVRESIVSASSKLTHLIKEMRTAERTILIDAPKAVTYSFKNVNREISFNMLFHTAKWFIEGKIKQDGYFESKFSSPVDINETQKNQMNTFFNSCIYIELFLQYAEVQTKELKATRQIWNDVTCLYNNKTDTDITIIDSTWFTELVKSDAFKVRGHFRLQPFGEGMKERRLIWINEFQKEGYTREAKKLTELTP